MPRIIRNRQKIEATIRNARAFLAVREEFGSFDAYQWGFVGGRPRVNRWISIAQIPATSPESDAMSKDMKRRGFGFVGSTDRSTRTCRRSAWSTTTCRAASGGASSVERRACDGACLLAWAMPTGSMVRSARAT